MIRLVLKRLLSLIPLLFLVTFVTFSLILLVPGDPAVTLAGDNATPEQIDATRERLGLNDPMLVQYGKWVADVVTGDLGTSLYRNEEVSATIMDRLPVTLSLTFFALVVALALAIPAGLVSGTRAGKASDKAATVAASIGVAMPSFLLALLLLLAFAIRNPWFPATGYTEFAESPAEWLRHLVLPALTLGAAAAAEMTRQLRSSLVDVLKQDYMRTAWSKGLSSRAVVGKHALKNAAAPMLTVAGMQVTVLLGGSIIVEQIFGLPGLGQLVISAVNSRDLPMIQGVVVASVFIAVLANLAVDLMYGYLNPKVRAQ